MRFPLQRFLLCRSLAQLLIALFNGMLANKDSTLRLAIYSKLSYFVISLEKLKQSLIVNTIRVRGSSKFIKNVAIFYQGIFIADKVDQNFGNLFMTGLWVLGLYQYPGVERSGQI